MVDKKPKLSRGSRPGSTRSSTRSSSGGRSSKGSKTRSPPPLPPRWGESGAPPSSPDVRSLTALSSPRKFRTLPLSYPSPPLMTGPVSAPLTSTFLASPGPGSGRVSAPPPGTRKMLANVRALETLHTTSPSSPEMSGIARAVTDVTTYQNYEAGVAYVPAGELCAPDAQLSRFQVSPPHPGNNPRDLGPGTLLNNRQRATHAARGWIYGANHSRLAARNLSLPKKV